VFFYYICFCPFNQHHQDKPEINVSHSISDPSGLPQPTLRMHSKAKLKSNGDKASPCIRPFCMRQILTYLDFYSVSLKYTSINQTVFTGTSDSMRILHQNFPHNRITCCLFVYKWLRHCPTEATQIRQQLFLYSSRKINGSSYNVCYQLQLHEWNEKLFFLMWWLFFFLRFIQLQKASFN